MSEILFWGVRHGRTQGNDDDRYRGWSNAEFAQLSSEGKADEVEAALFLKKKGLSFPIILSDDTARAKESQEILASILNIPEMDVDKRLRPLNVGDFTGKDKDSFPLDEYFKNPSKKIPGGESLNDFNRRLAAVIADVLELIAKIKQPVLVILHGSTISFLHMIINKQNVGYEGLVEPGGVVTVSQDSVVPVLKKKDGKKLEETANKKSDKKANPKSEPKSSLVQLSKWSIGFVGGKETKGQPKACQNCHLMYEDQKTCSILGPDILIQNVNKDGKLYTPVCGEHDAGNPLKVSDEEAKYNLNALVGPEKADQVGLEWAEGKGTNCGGANEGAPCKYFESSDNKDGICQVLGKKDNEVDSDDCCAAHDGASMPWQEAQKILKDEEKESK